MKSIIQRHDEPSRTLLDDNQWKSTIKIKVSVDCKLIRQSSIGGRLSIKTMTGYTDQEMLKINAEKIVVNIGRQEKKGNDICMLYLWQE